MDPPLPVFGRDFSTLCKCESHMCRWERKGKEKETEEEEVRHVAMVGPSKERESSPRGKDWEKEIGVHAVADHLPHPT